MRKMSNAKQKDYFALKYGREPGSSLTSFSDHKKITEMANKSQTLAIREELKQYPTKEDLREELKQYPTKEDLRQELKQYATKEDLRQEVRRLELKISETKADLI